MKYIFDFFYYTKAERKACVLLLVLCSLAFTIPEWLDFSPHYDLQPLGKAPRVLQVRSNWAEPKGKRVGYKKSYPQRFSEATPQVAVFSNFDPNDVSLESLLKMGLPSRSAQIWVKYLSKGGRFKKMEDVLKIYGLPEKWYQKAMPYMRIAPTNERPASNPETHFSKKEWTKTPSRSCEPIDVNTADTSAWQSLRGIGKVLASRIVKFRDKLGGFYAIEQIKETYGLADSVYQKILPCLQLSNPVLKPLPINQASFNELASHPYLGYKAAKAILSWKDQHGPYAKMEDLEAIVALDRQQLSKIKPYLQF